MSKFDSRIVLAVVVLVIVVAAFFVYRQVEGTGVQPSDIHIKVPTYDPNAGAPGGARQAGGR